MGIRGGSEELTTVSQKDAAGSGKALIIQTDGDEEVSIEYFCPGTESQGTGSG